MDGMSWIETIREVLADWLGLAFEIAEGELAGKKILVVQSTQGA